MIYFKVSSVIEESDNTSLSSIVSTIRYAPIIKIGYTDDNPDVAKRRDNSYRTENPSIIHYKYIMGGDTEIERGIHEYLKEHLYAGREWYNLTQEVIDFVEGVNSIDDIIQIIKTLPPAQISAKRNYKDKSKYLKYLIPSILSTIYPNIDLGLDLIKISEETELEFLKINYSNTYEEDILKLVDFWFKDYFEAIKVEYVRRKDQIISQEASIILKEFESKITSIDKMKCLCESLSCLTDYKVKIEVLNHIDLGYSIYYIVLGPERIQGLSYQKSKLDVEYRKLINNLKVDIASEIYSRFKEGEKYISSELKELLRDIYNSIGYERSPKATDIEEWFSVKTNIKIKDSDGKWARGIELIKKKG